MNLVRRLQSRMTAVPTTTVHFMKGHEPSTKKVVDGQTRDESFVVVEARKAHLSNNTHKDSAGVISKGRDASKRKRTRELGLLFEKKTLQDGECQRLHDTRKRSAIVGRKASKREGNREEYEIRSVDAVSLVCTVFHVPAILRSIVG